MYKQEIESAEDRVREFIKSYEKEGYGAQDVIIRDFAVWMVIQEFDWIYIMSFQSQLQALTLITSCPPVSKNTMLAIYNEAMRNYPNFYSGTEFADWLKFFKDKGLIKEEEDKYSPTDKAIAFIKHIERYKWLPKLF